MARRYRTCPDCQGEGYPPNSAILCETCEGSGRLYYKGMLSSETQMEQALSSLLQSRGYQVLVDPGGGSFLDVVALKLDHQAPQCKPEVGFIELKISSARETAEQALTRLQRYTGDWAAVCHPNKNSLKNLANMDEPGFQGLGLLHFKGGNIEVLREWEHRPRPSVQYQGPWPLLWPERHHVYQRLVQIAVVEAQGHDLEAFWGSPRGCSLTGLKHPVERMHDLPAPPVKEYRAPEEWRERFVRPANKSKTPRPGQRILDAFE